MARVAQRTMDGISVTNHKARFTGSVPLEDVEADAASIDEVLVMVVVAKVDDVQVKLDRAGDLNRINVVKVTDTRLLVGDLKDVLVERLGLYGADTAPPVTINHASQAPRADPETGEITVPDDQMELDFDAWTPPPVQEHRPDPDAFTDEDPDLVEVGHIGQRDPLAQRSPGSDGPKVKPFQDFEAGAPAQGQVVGSIHDRPGRRADSELTSFLEAP